MRVIYSAVVVITLFLFCSTAAHAQDTRALNELAAEQLKNGEVDAAIDTFRKILVLSPNDAVANYNLGVSYYALGQYDRAVPALRNAIKSKPDMADAYVYLGNSLDNLKYFDQALAAYSKAVAIDPRNAEAYFEIGVANEKQKNTRPRRTLISVRTTSIRPNLPATAHSPAAITTPGCSPSRSLRIGVLSRQSQRITQITFTLRIPTQKQAS